MRHLFYGETKEIYATENVALTLYSGKHWLYGENDYLEKHYKQMYLVPEKYVTKITGTTGRVLMRESNLPEVHNAGDKVTIDSKEGIINKKVYDVDTDTYSYYTNITASVIDKFAESFHDATESVKQTAKWSLDRLCPDWDKEEEIPVNLKKTLNEEEKELLDSYTEVLKEEEEPDNSTIFLVGSLVFFGLLIIASVAMFI
jgi:hypothetical protein